MQQTRGYFTISIVNITDLKKTAVLLLCHWG
jgi:hypothetical protein